MDTDNAVQEVHFGVYLKLYKPAVAFIFGYRVDESVHPKTRREMKDVVRWV